VHILFPVSLISYPNTKNVNTKTKESFYLLRNLGDLSKNEHSLMAFQIRVGGKIFGMQRDEVTVCEDFG
jgi:hypothetical protein